MANEQMEFQLILPLLRAQITVLLNQLASFKLSVILKVLYKAVTLIGCIQICYRNIKFAKLIYFSTQNYNLKQKVNLLIPGGQAKFFYFCEKIFNRFE